jgi:hypothetical protein
MKVWPVQELRIVAERTCTRQFSSEMFHHRPPHPHHQSHPHLRRQSSFRRCNRHQHHHLILRKPNRPPLLLRRPGLRRSPVRYPDHNHLQLRVLSADQHLGPDPCLSSGLFLVDPEQKLHHLLRRPSLCPHVFVSHACSVWARPRLCACL